MIHTNRIVTVGEQECIIDRPIVLYRGDREVEIEFTLVGNEFMFSEDGNVIKSVNASHGQLVLNTPSGENMFSELSECHEGKVVFVVTKEMIDEFIEMGFYSFQIRLYDSAEMKSRVTIPPVLNGFDVRNPIAAEDETNVVNQGIVDYARIFKDQSNEELPTFDWTGAYNKTEWVHHDVITENKMNKIEDALYSINANIKESDVHMLNTLDQVKKDADKYVKEHMAEVEDDVEEFERNLNTDVQQFKIDTNAAMTVHKNEVSDILTEYDDELMSIANSIHYISPKNFNDNIQAAIEYAFTNNIPCVKLEGKKYTLSDSVLLYSNMTLEGVRGKTILELKGVDKPVIDKKGSILGHTHIKNIRVVGDTSLEKNNGIVLNDYYSSIVNCEAHNCGGYGFYMREGSASSTLVENRIENCIARNCSNTSFYLGSETNKITDGFLLNCISCGNNDNTALFIGSSAGWNINGLHTYGHKNANDVVRVLNSFHTFINNIYIEDFNGTALNLSKCQQGLNVSNLTLNFKEGLTDSRAIYLNHSSYNTLLSNVNISNVTINNGGNLTNCSIYSGDNSNYSANVSNTSVRGGFEGLNLIRTDLSEERYKLISDALITSKLRITKDLISNIRGLTYDGYKIPTYKSGKLKAGATENTITIPLNLVYDYDKLIVNFKMYTSAWDTGVARIKYSTELLVSLKTGTNCKVYNNVLFEPVGFTVNPAYSLDRTEKTLTVTFTPSASDGEGIWVCEIYQITG